MIYERAPVLAGWPFPGWEYSACSIQDGRGFQDARSLFHILGYSRAIAARLINP